MGRFDSRAAAWVSALSLVGCGTPTSGTQAIDGDDAGLDALSPSTDASTANDGRAPLGDGAPGPGCGSAYVAPVSTDPAAPPVADPALAGQTHHYFKITVHDAAGGAPIAGAELRTTSAIVLTSDVNGVIAFYEPGLMGLSVYFSISHPGYQYPADFLGNRGVKLAVTEGGTADITLQKTTGTAAAAQTDLQSRLVAGAVPGPSACTTVWVIDPKNKRGIPLVRLTAFGEDYWTDSQGILTYCNPDHMGANVTFDVFSHGYALPSGATTVIATTKGSTASLSLDRANIAERLYRISGQGIYRDSLLAGLKTPLKHPVINAQVISASIRRPRWEHSAPRRMCRKARRRSKQHFLLRIVHRRRPRCPSHGRVRRVRNGRSSSERSPRPRRRSMRLRPRRRPLRPIRFHSMTTPMRAATTPTA